jgi:hypothetical protein
MSIRVVSSFAFWSPFLSNRLPHGRLDPPARVLVLPATPSKVCAEALALGPPALTRLRWLTQIVEQPERAPPSATSSSASPTSKAGLCFTGEGAAVGVLDRQPTTGSTRSR